MNSYSSIDISKLRNTTIHALENLGHSYDDAVVITDTLMYAELRANNQGLIKLVSGALSPSSGSTEIKTIFDTPVSSKIDGGQRSGMVVVATAVDIAIRKAKTSGIGLVGCSNYSSATGALGAWAKKIADEGLIAIVMTQCSEMVAPNGSYEAIYGTNPIAIGIPTQPRPQVLDMATSAMAWYGLKTAEAEGQPIPDDVAYDATGHATTNPSDALKGALRVFDRNHKGSHLALMIELLAGALTGADMEDKAQRRNWGSLVIAIDPAVMGPDNDFKERAMIMCNRVKNAKRLPDQEDKELFLPGERGDAVADKNLQAGTVPILDSIFQKLELMATKGESAAK